MRRPSRPAIRRASGGGQRTRSLGGCWVGRASGGGCGNEADEGLKTPAYEIGSGGDYGNGTIAPLEGRAAGGAALQRPAGGRAGARAAAGRARAGPLRER